MWSKYYEGCINCGTVDIRHLARGLCARCYYRAADLRNSSKDRNKEVTSKILTKQFLEKEYLFKKRSACEISRIASCSRQYVYMKLAEYKIPIRSHSAARALALEKGKITFIRRTKSGQSKSFVLKKRIVNEAFFRSWSKEMAWVLGVVYTDGYIDPGRQKDSSRSITSTTARLSIGQKEPELLLKVKHLMGSNAQMIAVTGGTLTITVSSNKIYNDLENIGLRPHKSLNVRFPNVPKTYLSHFIRGCWDGDGSIGLYEGKYQTRFFGSSISFMESLVKHLFAAGLPQRNISVRYTKRHNPYYTISFKGSNTGRLYEFLYKDADPSCYLERKHKLFKSAYEKYQGSGAAKGKQLEFPLN